VIGGLLLDRYWAAKRGHFDEKMKLLDGRIDMAERDAVERKRELAESKRERDQMKATLKAAEARLAKHRLLLLARISDYSRELDFWRNTVRKMLVDRGGSISGADELIAGITRQLKTYGASEHGDAPFDAIMVAAEMLRDTERKESGGYQLSSTGERATAGDVYR
jgi:hypothetical protein